MQGPTTLQVSVRGAWFPDWVLAACCLAVLLAAPGGLSRQNEDFCGGASLTELVPVLDELASKQDRPVRSAGAHRHRPDHRQAGRAFQA